MSEQKYTNGKWLIGDKHEVCAISDQLNNGYMIAECHGPDREANARRIIACVNACAGISDLMLEFGAPAKLSTVIERECGLTNLMQQRDAIQSELAAARADRHTIVNGKVFQCSIDSEGGHASDLRR